MLRRIASVIAFAMLFNVSGALSAPVDPLLPFTKKTNLQVPKRHTLRFSLWDNADPSDPAGQMIWSEERTWRLKKKLVRHMLGSVDPHANPLDASWFSQQLWVELARKMPDGSFSVLGNRTKLNVVPYAAWSAVSDTPGVPGPRGPVGGDGVSCWDLNGDGIGTPSEDTNGDGNYDALDCRGPQGPAGPEGAQGLRGAQGPQGPAGEAGRDGTFCWDLNGDGIRDKEEDVNGDEIYDALDCRGPRGPAGPEGPQGPAGADGVDGIDGVDGNLGLAGLGCPAGTPVAGFDAAGTMLCADGSPAVPDSDGDGLVDTDETALGTNPANPDSDGDGLKDGEEYLTYGTSPLWEDSDFDLLLDGEEVNVYGTDPAKADTDGDSQGWERVKIPRSCMIACTTYDLWGATMDDWQELNIHGTDPLKYDTDGDGLKDGLEVALNDEVPGMVDPLLYDTDADSVPDDIVTFPPGCGGPFPLPPCVVLKGAGIDTNDGWEFWEGLNPGDPDTDGDGVWDGQELFDGTDPKDPASYL